MTLPIDDVWLTGESVAGVPGQRIHVDTRGDARAAGSSGRAVGPTPDRPTTRSAPTRTGRPEAGASTPVDSGRQPAFDPTSFDPGPDLPPLPTLTPLPTFRPLSQWPKAGANGSASSRVEPADAVDQPVTVDQPVADTVAERPNEAADGVASASTASTAPPDLVPEPEPAAEAERESVHDRKDPESVPSPEPDAEVTIRVSGVSPPDGRPDEISAQAVAPSAQASAEPVRRRRRGAEEPEIVTAATATTATEVAAQKSSTGVQDASSRSDEQPGTRRVLVLGGSGAVGSAVVRALAAQGARVAVHHASRAAEAGALVDDLPGQGHLSIGADLADSDDVAALISSVAASFDGLDVVINAASAGQSVPRTSIVGSSLASWTDAWTGTLTVDVLGAATVAHAAAAAFVERGRGGRIILLAAKGRPFDDGRDSVRIATERAVGALGAAVAEELAPYGIGVVVVGSGSAAASGWSPEALAETVAWLAFGPTAALPGAVFNVAG